MMEAPWNSPDTVIETATSFLALFGGDTREAAIFPISRAHDTCFYGKGKK